jgi:hypothetical protein
MFAVQETGAQATDQIGKALIAAGLVVAMFTTIQAVAVLA